MNNWTSTLIWIAVIGGLFAFLWWRGYLNRLRDYVAATREELNKCTWPTRDELKGSTVLVAVSILLLGVFTMAVDWIMVNAVIWLDKI